MANKDSAYTHILTSVYKYSVRKVTMETKEVSQTKILSFYNMMAVITERKRRKAKITVDLTFFNGITV